jgi:ATP-dependent helicase HrpB
LNKPFQLSLPIDEALPRLTAALSGHSTAVLVAPPGAGKTTRVPLVLMDESWARAAKSPAKILVLEPRRLAARAAAERMASTLGEKVGGTVGYRVRFGSKVSRSTRIEVVTEGIFTRMIVDDPSLEGVAAVLFDEFHERSLDADLGLALAREAQQGLREDLKLLVMSATIDGARIAALLGDAAVIESQGRAFPVETRHVSRDQTPIEAQVTDTVLKTLRADPGSVLVFLPGAAEIRRTETRLKERVTDPSVDIVALYGALDAAVQDRAIAPASAGRRKVVLATSIAETSLTIEGVRVVVDSGLARVPRYEPDVGLTRLETVRVSRASADQRRGRAGRTEPGVCYRLWDEGQTASLEPYAKPEILAADLSSFVLDLAQWGVTDPATLAFIDPPPAPALAEARSLLAELGALDPAGRITAEGRRLRALPLPPRLARMIVDAAGMKAAAMAAQVAAILTERGLGGDDIDLAHRLDNFRRDRSRRGEEARRMAARWAEMAQPLSPPVPSPARGGESGRGQPHAQNSRPTPLHSPPPPQVGPARLAHESAQPGQARVAWGREQGEASPGLLLALAYPDRIARNRGSGSFLLANGRGAMVDSVSPLARAPYIAVAELIGSAAQARIVLAAAIGLADIEARFAQRIEVREEITIDAATLSLRARRQRRLGAVALADAPMAVTTDEAAARLLAAAIAKAGFDRLPWTKAQQQWRERVLFLRTAEGDEWPDVSETGLGASIDDWLVPALFGKTSLSQLGADDLGNALAGLLPHGLRRRLDAEAPTHFAAPSGSQVPIDYGGEDGPKLSIRVQELFGLSVHPTTARGRVPLLIELLSPAHRPVQLTRDLPGFWRGSYAAVRAEMRGRYPRHPWPDDPMSAPATRRAKPRGT